MGESAVVCLAAGEAPSPHDASLGRVLHWTLSGGSIQLDPGAVAGATHVFFVADGRGNPIDQLEAVKPWQTQTGTEIARVYTFVNCRFAEAHPQLAVWYDACIHFSDAVLLGSREGVANKWISDFQSRYKDQFYPCLFEFVKDGRVKNPPLMLEPEARRMSHFFDEPEWVEAEGGDFEMGTEDEEGAETTENEEIELVAEVDPWMERRAGGRRVKELPDVAKYLGGDAPVKA